MNIKELIQKAHENAESKGFWDDFNMIGALAESQVCSHLEYIGQAENALISQRLMLIVGEVAEAQEALRKHDTDNFKEELADIAIRLGDLCGGLEIDLEAEIIKKMEYNASRPYKHGKEF